YIGQFMRIPYLKDAIISDDSPGMLIPISPEPIKDPIPTFVSSLNTI
ncbi:unnamed protein product, partial [marine sediment metagenome]